jgi:hypothetical protein
LKSEIPVPESQATISGAKTNEGATRSFGYSGEHEFLNRALKSKWASFSEIVAEMNSFVPRPISDYSEEYEAQLKETRKNNPQATEEQITEWVKRDMSFFSSAWYQAFKLFYGRFEAEYATIIILSHALCEAIINMILALGLANKGTTHLFPMLERRDIQQKFRRGPKYFSPTYSLSPSSSIFQTLKYLTAQRNALVHLKIQVEVNGEEVLKGSDFRRKSYDEDIQWAKRFFGLPYDFIDFIEHTRKDFEFPFVILDRGPIERAHSAAST